MKLVFKTESSKEPDCFAECEVAVLDLTPELMQRIRKRVETSLAAQKADKNVSEVAFWAHEIQFYDYDLVEKCSEARDGFEKDLDANNYSRLPFGVDLSEFTPQRTECDRIVILLPDGEVEISWKVIPKHTDVYINTVSISLAQLEKIYAQG